ncbi:MAG: hypothetical protein FWF33_03795 [Clostridiales bacterium]|nr:hypothetical protein [Clostridiales bacterium]
MNLKDVRFYENEVEAIKRELESLPDGYLIKRGMIYYERTGTVQKGITKDLSRVKRLVRKAYLLRRLQNLKCNYALAKKLTQQYKAEEPMEIIRELSSFYQTFPVDYFFHSSAHERFENIPEGGAGHTEGLVYLTNSGLRVRSKSERTIADALDKNGIPYRYEAALTLGDENRFPDYTITRPFDGKTILWEHFGRMDQSWYRHKTVEKLALYAQYGFFPFDNLICTYERDLQDTAHIQAIMKIFLLR